MSRIRYFMAFAAVALLAGTASLALAQTWTGPVGTPSNWDLPANWGGVAPDPSWQGSNLTINNGGIALIDGTTTGFVGGYGINLGDSNGTGAIDLNAWRRPCQPGRSYGCERRLHFVG